jgi:hypothetical protein
MQAETRKIGEGHAEAMWRAGLKELAQVLPAFPNHSVQPVEEYGLAGNLPPDAGRDKGTFAEERQAYAARGAGQEQERNPKVER